MRRFHWYDHISINLFWLALNIRNNAIGSVFMPYLVDMFVRPEIKNTALGGLRTAGLIVAMLVQLAMGLLSDRSRSRFGRRRPYLVVGVLLDLLFLAAIYYAWNFSSLVAVIMLVQFSSNMSHGPLQALIPDLVPEKQRGVSSSFKSIFELIPLILVGATIAPLVGAGRMDTAFLVTGASLLVILALSLVLIKEQPLVEKPNIPFWPPMLRVMGMLGGILSGGLAGLLGGGLAGGLVGLIAWPLAGSRTALMIGVSLGGLVAMVLAVASGVYAGVLFTLGQNGPRENAPVRSSFTWWVINRLLFLAAITSIQSFLPYFLMDAFQIDTNRAIDLSGQLLKVIGVFILVTALVSGWVSDRVGHRRILIVCGGVAALGSFLLLGVIWSPAMNLIYVAGAFLGVATGLFMTANWALGTELVPAQEAGRYLGISNLAGAGAGMIGSGMGGPIADYLNSLLPGMGYFVLFACYGVLFLLSSASLRWVHASLVERPAEPSVPVAVELE